MKKISKNTKETAKIAKIFFDKILKKKGKDKRSMIVCLSGELGSGKTAFVQHIAKYLGIKNKVNSPTFVIMKKYAIKKNKDYNFLFHLDAYRLKNEKELLYLGWEEIISKKEHLIFIEWPENVHKIIPKNSAHILISHNKNGSRKLELK